MKRRPPFYFVDGKVVVPGAEERIAAVLAGIKEDLERKPVTDPKVWSGYPDGWRPGDDDEDDPRVPVGLFLNLERCTRGNPTWQMARAIEIAFELGRASIVGKADHDAAERLVDTLEKRAKGVKNAGDRRGSELTARAEASLHVLKDVWRAYRGQFGDGHTLVGEVFATNPRRCVYVDGAGRERRYVPDVGRDRARALFGEWAREEKWAAGWIAVGDEYIQDTRDHYRVTLFSNGGEWRLRIKAPHRLEWTPEGSGSMDEAKDAGYRIIKMLREKARAEVKARKARIAGSA